MKMNHQVLLFFALGTAAAQEGGEPAKGMDELQEKATAFKNQFVSLSSDALDLQCKQLEAARSSGQAGLAWLEKTGPDGTTVADHLGKLCGAVQSKQPDYMKEVVQGEKEYAKVQVKTATEKANFYQASALGCNTLFKAQNDGKMEWFETKKWYKKTLEMCESLSQKSPVEVEEAMQQSKGKVISSLADLEGDTPIELMKNSCSKLVHAPPEMHEKPWFMKAKQMCATVSGASNDDLRSMLQRMKMQAESGSGQLIKDTCSKLDAAKQQGTLERYEREPWYRATAQMCSKMGSPKVHASGPSGLQRRCAWLDHAKRYGKLSPYMAQPWYMNLVKTCSWIKNKRNGEGFGAKPVPERAGEASSVFV
jgi:hypothetical protein